MRLARTAAREAAHARDQLLARVADVLEHVGHRVAGDDVLDVVAAAGSPSETCTVLVSPNRLCRSPRISW